MQKKDGRILYSPSDLIVFMSGSFSSWMDRRYLENPSSCVPDEIDEMAEIVRKHGVIHEQEYLRQLENSDIDVFTVTGRGEESRQQTLDAMRAGKEVIYQAYLRVNNFAGAADFLVKAEGSSDLGDFHYEVWDSKLAKKPKPYFLVQLCCYAEMLESIQGRLPEKIGVVLGSKDKVEFALSNFYSYYLSLKNMFLRFQEEFDPDCEPEWLEPGDYSRWKGEAQRILEKRDDLIRVANIRKSQIKLLKEHGIRTLTELASGDIAPPPRMAERTFESLRAQARLQLESKNLDRPAFEIIRSPDPAEAGKGLAALPPPSELDVYFDMEGYPYIEGGLEYLFGAFYYVGQRGAFTDWWAHNRVQEKTAFQQFVDWIYKRWLEDPGMHVYHYGSYEVSALRRLSIRHATREAEIDKLLRAEIFVDLYAIVRKSLRVGTDSYSIKKLEALYRAKREGEVSTAADSIVFYERWLEQNDGEDCCSSLLLKQIRDYNEIDCESTAGLCSWLRERQHAEGVDYSQSENSSEGEKKKLLDAGKEPGENERLAEQLLASIPEDRNHEPEKWHVVELMAQLLGFHRREDKIVWWEWFDRLSMSEEELFFDPECIVGARRTSKLPHRQNRSYVYEYKFDPEQDCKIAAGDTVAFTSNTGIKPVVESIDLTEGILNLKSGSDLPSADNLILFAKIRYDTLQNALAREASRLLQNLELSPCLHGLLLRQYPRVSGVQAGAPLCVRASVQDGPEDGEQFIQGAIDAIRRLDCSHLCVQGPPGTGKTYLAARAIVSLIKEGKRVGVSSNSHKAIENLLKEIVSVADRENIRFHAVKLGSDESVPAAELTNSFVEFRESNAPIECVDKYQLVAATAWGFSKKPQENKFDYLFIDEAGQVCLANVAAMAASASNLVLIGDQLQLEQPVRGSHPGESGKSVLEYLMGNNATVSSDRGIFLDLTRRLHPSLCELVSSAVYEKRLRAHPDNARRKIIPSGKKPLLSVASGILFLPVQHRGNSQSSPEEVDCIKQLISELLECEIISEPGEKERKFSPEDMIIVSPYNQQVRLLKNSLPGLKVGTVDKFQGQEAPVAIVSMSASDLSNSARGIEFLLSKKRLNVAISRAKILAVVVGSPELGQYVCSNIDQASLLNLYCKIMTDGSCRS